MTTAPTTPARRASRSLPAVALLAMLLAACIGAPNPSPLASPSARASATPAPSSTPTATPLPTAQLGRIAWVELAAENVSGLSDMIAYEGGYLGIGAIGVAADEAAAEPAVYVTPDLVEWTAYPVTTLPGDALWAPMAPAQVAAIGDQLVVLASGPSVPTVYVADGPAGPWTAVDLGAEACPAELAASGESVVVVGAIGACGYGGSTRPAAWFSRDGTTWKPVELTSSGTGGGWISGVVGLEDGFIGWGRWLKEPICDVGCDVDVETDPFAGAPWISADGATWRRVDDPDPFRDTLVDQVAVIGDMYLALGWRGQGEGAVRAMWTSSEGLGWQPLVDEPPFLAAMNQRIAGDSAGLVAWTIEATSSSLWYSFDGTTWERGATLEGNIGVVKIIEDAFFAFGTREEADPGITPPCTKDQVVGGRCRTVSVVWIGAS